MKKSILNLGKTLNKVDQKKINGGRHDDGAYPNCGTKHCNEQKGFICNPQGNCDFLGHWT